MTAIPSLSSAFSSLLAPLTNLFSAPAKPAASSYTSVGVSSPSALGLPASPNMSVYTPPAPAANMSVAPKTANQVAAAGTVPYLPNNSAGYGGMSLVPTGTSATTGLPTSSVPGAISPASSKGTLPILPSISSTKAPTVSTAAARTSNATSTSNNSSTYQPSIGPAIPNLGSASDTNYAGSSIAPGISGGSGAGAGGGIGGFTSPGASFGAAGGASDPYGLSYFSSTEQQNAEKALQASLQMSPNELADQKALNALNASAATSYTNTAGQPIPLPFITGQQAQIQRSQATLAQPLESALTLAQAQRGLAGTAAQSALTQANNRISSYQDFLKPVPTSYGGTLSQFDPTTGTYKTLVNPFGTATGTATGGSGSGTDITTTIGNAIAHGQITQDMVTRYGIPFIAATLQADPGYNFITQKASVAANSASLKTQQGYVDTVTRAFNTANENLTSLTSFMTTNGLNQSSVPLINQLQNKVKAGVTDAGTIAAFQSALSGLRAEYAQVLARGGEVTDSARNSATTLIPDNISPAQLQQVAQRLNIEGQNAISAATQQVQTITGRTGSNTGGSNLGTSGGDPSNPFSASNFFGT